MQSMITVERYFDRKPLAYTLEEIMLLLLIIGRWLLPKGSISRDQLSQLLFVYFGISFDMMELFYLFDEPYILRDNTMNYVILAVWSFSLFQFTIVLTAIKSRRPRLSLQLTPLRRLTSFKCCHFEIWSLLTTVVMQDGPYLLLRIYCIIGMNLFSYNLLFYTIKNALVVILQAYRFTVLLLNCREDFDPNTLNAIYMASITRVSRPDALTNAPRQGTARSFSSLSRGASVNSISNNQNYSFESTV